MASFPPPMRRPASALLVLAAAACAVPGALRAQGNEAPPPAQGVLRVLLPPVWWRWDRRFSEGTPGHVTGALEPAGIDFGAESLGVSQLPFLGPSQSLLRTVTRIPAFTLSLGQAVLRLNANVRAMPLGVALGISRRLSVSVLVPLVRSRVEAFFQMDTAAARRGTVGWNPAYATPGALDAFRGQVDAALGALRTQAAAGPAALRPQAQAALDQLGPLWCGLYTVAGGSAADPTSVCYSATQVSASPFLPLGTSEAGDSITSRLAGAQASWSQLVSAYAGAGVALPSFTAAFVLPSAAVTRDDVQRFLQDTVLGAGGDSLAMVLHTRLGDVEAAATYVFADRPRYQGRVMATVRLPTGMVDSHRDFIDVGTGDHQLDVELGVRSDLTLGTSFRVVAAGRIGIQFADQLERRVSPPSLPIAPLARLALVRRDLGDYVGLDITPTWRLDEALSLGVRYAYFRQGSTRFSYEDTADSARTGLPASVLDQETAVRWMRIGVGVTFSTLSRFAAGRASLPYTLTIGYQNTLWGRGGRTPQASLVYIDLASYFRLWGSGKEMGRNR